MASGDYVAVCVESEDEGLITVLGVLCQSTDIIYLGSTDNGSSHRILEDWYCCALSGHGNRCGGHTDR